MEAGADSDGGDSADSPSLPDNVIVQEGVFDPPSLRGIADLAPPGVPRFLEFLESMKGPSGEDSRPRQAAQSGCFLPVSTASIPSSISSTLPPRPTVINRAEVLPRARPAISRTSTLFVGRERSRSPLQGPPQARGTSHRIRDDAELGARIELFHRDEGALPAVGGVLPDVPDQRMRQMAMEFFVNVFGPRPPPLPPRVVPPPPEPITEQELQAGFARAIESELEGFDSTTEKCQLCLEELGVDRGTVRCNKCRQKAGHNECIISYMKSPLEKKCTRCFRKMRGKPAIRVENVSTMKSSLQESVPRPAGGNPLYVWFEC